MYAPDLKAAVFQTKGSFILRPLSHSTQYQSYRKHIHHFVVHTKQLHCGLKIWKSI